ncbi:MAG: alpha/beta hydrolase [Bryobacterales bacterium]|nr:alpha/beta hydrolase [Bryobacterales bacterium]
MLKNACKRRECVNDTSSSPLWIPENGAKSILGNVLDNTHTRHMTTDISVELAFDRIDGTQPKRAIAFLHGILGRGNNLRTIARRFVEARPGWTAWLVDLRGHGRSPKGTPAPSLESAARDVVDFAGRLAPPLGAIVGHSFGGKVALEAARIGAISLLEHVIVIDSVPGVRDPLRGEDSALAVMDAIESLPRTLASRSDFIEALVAAGKTRPLAQWLAGSVEREGDHVRFMLDLNEVRALILDYFARDLWPVVEHPPGAARMHLVIGDHSGSYSPADRERAARIAASSERVTVDVLAAGHWVHVDNPDGLLRKLLDHIGG